MLDLQSAYKKVQDVALHINEQTRHVENMSILLSIQTSITSTGSSSIAAIGSLMMPHRRLIRSGILHKTTSGLISTSHPRKVYLFNDLLIWCEPSTSALAGGPGSVSSGTGTSGGGSFSASGVGSLISSGGGEKFRGHVDLATVQVREYFEKGGRTGFRLTPLENTPIGNNGTLTSPTKKSSKLKEITFLCPNGTSEKMSWLDDIRQTQEMAQEMEDEVRRRQQELKNRRLSQHNKVASAQMTMTVEQFPEREQSTSPQASNSNAVQPLSAHSNVHSNLKSSPHVLAKSDADLFRPHHQQHHHQPPASIPPTLCEDMSEEEWNQMQQEMAGNERGAHQRLPASASF